MRLAKVGKADLECLGRMMSAIRKGLLRSVKGMISANERNGREQIRMLTRDLQLRTRIIEKEVTLAHYKPELRFSEELARELYHHGFLGVNASIKADRLEELERKSRKDTSAANSFLDVLKTIAESLEKAFPAFSSVVELIDLATQWNSEPARKREDQ